ncbi:MAG: hypothetical protein RIA62_02160 [Cyclobacteriaceae bacterium]
MGEPAIDLFDEKSSTEVDERNLKQKIFDTHTEELILGICGPIGTDIHFVSSRIQEILEQQFNYTVKKIRLSDFIKRLSKSIDFSKIKDENKKIHELISAGNKLREKHENNILAALAINEIAVEREMARKSKEFKSQRICYIIDSIKNNEELELFRLVYRGLFYFLGIFSPIEIREKYLEDKGLKKDQVYKLFDRDSGEDFDHGQKVTDTFVKADFFLRIDKSTTQIIGHCFILS